MEKIAPGHERRISYLNNLMVVICDFTSGPMEIPEKPHSHPHEQITYVEEGELYFFIGEERLLLKKGDIVSIPSETSHCIQNISTFVRLIDSFSPIREDFLESH